MAQKHADERRVWVNERQQPPFIFKPPPFQTSRYSIAKTLKSTHCNSIRNVIQATSQICQEPHSQLHQKTGVGWCHQAEQGDEQLEGRVAFTLGPRWLLKWTWQEAVRLHQSQRSGANLALAAMIVWLQPNDKTWPESLAGTRYTQKYPPANSTLAWHLGSFQL